MHADRPGDLVVLVADSNAKFAVTGLLSRHRSLRIRSPSHDVYVHPERDPGCCLKAHEFLRGFTAAYSHALVLFDREGRGREDESRASLENEVNGRLFRSGWGDRSAVIVIEPELDAWVWSRSPHVDSVLGWQGKRPSLREWLENGGHLQPGAAKPSRPKEALDAALRHVRKPRSSSLYRRMAEKVSLERCEDPAFLRLRELLRRWFPR